MEHEFFEAVLAMHDCPTRECLDEQRKVVEKIEEKLKRRVW